MQKRGESRSRAHGRLQLVEAVAQTTPEGSASIGRRDNTYHARVIRHEIGTGDGLGSNFSRVPPTVPGTVSFPDVCATASVPSGRPTPRSATLAGARKQERDAGARYDRRSARVAWIRALRVYEAAAAPVRRKRKRARCEMCSGAATEEASVCARTRLSARPFPRPTSDRPGTSTGHAWLLPRGRSASRGGVFSGRRRNDAPCTSAARPDASRPVSRRSSW
jgi:hypothetical protein